MIIHDASLLCGIAVMIERRCQTSVSQVFDNRGSGLLKKNHRPGTLFVQNVCLLYLAVHIELVKKCYFFESLIFLKNLGTQKMKCFETVTCLDIRIFHEWYFLTMEGLEMIIDVEAKTQLPRSSSIAEVCSLVGQLCAILYIITVCQLY